MDKKPSAAPAAAPAAAALSPKPESPPTSRVCTLNIHESKFSQEELVLNPEVFPEVQLLSYVEISAGSDAVVVLQVRSLSPIKSGRLQVSLHKSVADAFNFKAWQDVRVRVVDGAHAEVDFVELTFRNQYVTRGNIWAFKNAMLGRSVYVGQNVKECGIDARIRMIADAGREVTSGVVTKDTHLNFRSRSARLVWLVQISSEMWDYDLSGQLYFDLFINQFVDVLMEQWKALGVLHSLSIVFFARTLYLDEVDPIVSVKLSNPSIRSYPDGTHTEDFYTMVVENDSRIDKTWVMQTLKREFLEFPSKVGWRIPSAERSAPPTAQSQPPAFRVAVPSTATNGNVLEAINTTLNVLTKHYMDRDLNRTGNNIVMITAGTGVFKVDSKLAQITKQRMMDNGIGLDLVSLSQPPLHAAPLFVVGNRGSQAGAYFEIPNWVTLSFVQSPRNSNASISTEQKPAHGDASTTSTATTAVTTTTNGSTPESDLKYFRPLPFASFINSSVRSAKRSNRLSSALPHPLVAMMNRAAIDATHSELQQQEKKQQEQEENGRAEPSSDVQGVPLWGAVDAIGRRSHILLPHNCIPQDTDEGIPSTRRGTTSSENTPSVWSPDESSSSQDALEHGSSEGALRRRRSTPGSGVLEVINLKHLRGRTHLSSEDEAEHPPAGAADDFEFNTVPLPSADVALVQASQVEAFMEAHDAALFESHRSATTRQQLTEAHSTARLSESGASYTQLSATSSNPQMASPSAAAAAPIAKAAGRSSTLRPKPPTGIAKSRTRLHLNSGESLSESEGAEPKLRLSERLQPRLRPSKAPPARAEAMLSRSYEKNAAHRPGVASSGPGAPPMLLDGTISTSLETHRRRGSLGNSRSPDDQTALRRRTSSKDLKRYLTAEHLSAEEFYRRRYGINPFRRQEGSDFLKMRTHNRRRWSHVSPTKEFQLHRFPGLNWQSLCQPAILPLTTDFLTSVEQLRKSYTVSFYSLTLPEPEPNQEDDALQFLALMVSQRLIHEFQLVENVDVRGHVQFAIQRPLHGDVTNDPHIQVLTMGHRIQILYYDKVTRQVMVSRYLSRFGSNESRDNSFVYKYSLWVPQLNRFQPMTQTFFKYPNPELEWSLVDEILLGNLDEIHENVKYRRLRFAIIPEPITNTAAEDDYIAKFQKFQAFINSKAQKHWELKVKVLRAFPEDPSTAAPSPWGHVRTDRVKLSLRDQHMPNVPSWLYVQCDATMHPLRVYHFELHWVCCNSWVVDDFVSTIHRRGGQFGLRIAQVPEYSRASNLSVHPFIAQPYLAVDGYAARIAESYLLTRFDFVIDDERRTDWAEFGVEDTKVSPSSEELAAKRANTPQPVSSLQQQLSKGMPDGRKKPQPQSQRDSAAGAQPAPKPKVAPVRYGPRAQHNDRQYVHRTGCAFVRVAARGFVWVNNRLKVNDLNISSERRLEMSTELLNGFQKTSSVVQMCHSIVCDLVSSAVSKADVPDVSHL